MCGRCLLRVARATVPRRTFATTRLPTLATMRVTSQASSMSLALADKVCDAVLAERKAKGFAPLAVVVVDGAGQPVCAKREDGVHHLIPTFALSKATTCTQLGMSSRAFKDKYAGTDGAQQIGAMCEIGAGTLAPIAGGVLCLDAFQRVLGAVGVSGAAQDEDEHCALIGAHSAGLNTMPFDSKIDPHVQPPKGAAPPGFWKELGQQEEYFRWTTKKPRPTMGRRSCSVRALGDDDPQTAVY